MKIVQMQVANLLNVRVNLNELQSVLRQELFLLVLLVQKFSNLVDSALFFGQFQCLNLLLTPSFSPHHIMQLLVERLNLD